MKDKKKDIRCEIIFDNEFEKSNFFIRKKAKYCYKQSQNIYEEVWYEINKKKLKHIVLFLIFFCIIVFFCIAIWTKKGDRQQKEKLRKNNHMPIEEQILEEIEKFKEKPNENLTIYDRCSNEYLTEEEVQKLCKQTGACQLQFCINYIYARHGDTFELGSEEDIYFSKQDWYQELEKMTVKYEDLNDFEQKNIDLIVTILKLEGYRR